MRRKLIAGNWKMNMTTQNGLDLVDQIVGKIKSAGGKLPFDVLVCPPFTILAAVADRANGDMFTGSQDVSVQAEFGAYTGDVSAIQVADAGAAYAIVGHSERRAARGDTDASVNKKAYNAIEAGLIPVICVGETLQEREAGKALEIVSNQVKGSVPSNVNGNTVIAYEPVWAIGTGKVPTVGDVQEMHDMIRKVLTEMLGQEMADKVRILYGGSVKPGNAKELLAVSNVDGALIGGASLKVEDFWGIASTQLGA